jgi:hypothetical protein
MIVKGKKRAVLRGSTELCYAAERKASGYCIHGVCFSKGG